MSSIFVGPRLRCFTMIDVGTCRIKVERVPSQEFDLSLIFLSHYGGQMDGHDQRGLLFDKSLSVVTNELFDFIMMKISHCIQIDLFESELILIKSLIFCDSLLFDLRSQSFVETIYIIQFCLPLLQALLFERQRLIQIETLEERFRNFWISVLLMITFSEALIFVDQIVLEKLIGLSEDSLRAKVGAVFMLDAFCDQKAIELFLTVSKSSFAVVLQIFVVKEVIFGTQQTTRPLKFL